eukprot:2392719-Rhodomonas_salina.2
MGQKARCEMRISKMHLCSKACEDVPSCIWLWGGGGEETRRRVSGRRVLLLQAHSLRKSVIFLALHQPTSA